MKRHYSGPKDHEKKKQKAWYRDEGVKKDGRKLKYKERVREKMGQRRK